MSPEREPATLLREAMAAEARTVTASRAFTERVIGAAQTSPAAVARHEGRPAGQPAWRGWLLPAVAAVAAAVLLAAVLVGSALLRPDRQQPATPLPSLSTSVPTPGPSTSPSPAPTTSPGPSGQTAVGGRVPDGFRAADLTWVSAAEGWALGTAPCAQPPCTLIAHTTDGDRLSPSWVSLPAPAAGLGATDQCQSNCIAHLRFANPQVGYAYGSDRLFMTPDGGRTWSRQPGHADALEVGDGTVIRVTSKDPHCLPGCVYQVQRAAVGSSDWQDVSVPPGARTAGVELVRSGPVAAIATYAHTAGGAQDATSMLFLSADGGASWSARPDPCPNRTGGEAGGEVDTRAIAIGADRSISVLCTPRGTPGAQQTMTSTDGGQHFTAGSAGLGAGTARALGAASSQVLFAGLDSLYRSTDGGRRWQRIDDEISSLGFRTAPERVSYLGFQTPMVGRALELDTSGAGLTGSATIWTTLDAGQNWVAYYFG
ncbi:MAG: hypothetical protein ABI047_11690 [Jatrophihabitantaceae bacterium]